MDSNRKALEDIEGPKLTSYSECLKTPLDAFKLLFTPNMIQHILRHTNQHAADDPEWEQLTNVEFHGFLSELVVIGLHKSRKRSIKSLWTSEYFHRVPFYSTVMPRDRFCAIQKHLRFDDPKARASKIESTGDKLTPIRDLFEELRVNCMRSYAPSKTVTIDERLIPFRGKCSFKVYMPSKPSKYGMKMWVMADTPNSYACNFQMYFGGIDNTFILNYCF